jgi:hypothetical protein
MMENYKTLSLKFEMKVDECKSIHCDYLYYRIQAGRRLATRLNMGQLSS